MKAMSGFEIFEKMTNVNDRFIEEAAEMPNPELAVAVKISRREKFSRFMNSGWGVAVICGIVALGVMVGIIAAGRGEGPVKPPVGTEATESEIFRESDETQTELPTTEDSTLPEPPITETTIAESETQESETTQTTADETKPEESETIQSPDFEADITISVGSRSISLSFLESVTVALPTGTIVEDRYIDINGNEYVMFGSTQILKRFTDESLMQAEVSITKEEAREMVKQVLEVHAWPMLYLPGFSVAESEHGFICTFENDAARSVSGVGEDILIINMNGAGEVYAFDFVQSSLMTLCIERSTPADFANAYKRIAGGKSPVYYGVENNHLCLKKETIKYIMPPEAGTDEYGYDIPTSGCGIDHIHVFETEELLDLTIDDPSQKISKNTIRSGNILFSYTIMPDTSLAEHKGNILIKLTVKNMGDTFHYPSNTHSKPFWGQLTCIYNDSDASSYQLEPLRNPLKETDGTYTIEGDSEVTISFAYYEKHPDAQQIDLKFTAYGITVTFEDALNFK